MSTPDLSSLWVSTLHEKGSLHAEKLLDCLREANSAQARGERPPRWITGVFGSLEAALTHNRKMKNSKREGVNDV